MKNSNFMMELVIETLTGTTFELKVSPFETVLAVKAKIQRFEGIPIASQHLLYQDAELDEDSCLHDYGIKHGATLKLVLAMRGGPINTRRIPVEPERTEVSSAGSKHVTLLVFREGDQLNFFRVVDRGDGTLTPLAESLSSSSQHDSNGETDNFTSTTGETVTLPCFLGTSDSDDEEVSADIVDSSKNASFISKAKANMEADHIRNKMRQLQLKMDQVKLSRKNWNRKTSRLQPLHSTSASDALYQPHPPSESKVSSIRSMRYISSTAVGAAAPIAVSSSLGSVPLPQLLSQPPTSLPKMPPPEIIPLAGSRVYKLPSIVPSAAATTTTASSSFETTRLLSSRNRAQPSSLCAAVTTTSVALSGFEMQHHQQQQMTAGGGSKSSKKRCHQCGKKTGIINSYSCRCGNNFCTRHRYAELHACVFDYKSEGRLQLHNANPLVQASKLPKI